jgi:hypothetical protein
MEEFEEIQEKEGFKGFFKGNLVGCMRFVATGALQVVVYIGLKKLLASKDGNNPTPNTIALCTSLSGLIALFLTYPLDTIKVTSSKVWYCWSSWPSLYLKIAPKFCGQHCFVSHLTLFF